VSTLKESLAAQDNLPKTRGSRSVRIGPPSEVSSATYWPERKYHSLSLVIGPPHWTFVSYDLSVVGVRPGTFELLPVSESLV